MKLTKRILSGLLAAGMILSLTACDEEPAVSGGNSAGNTPGAPRCDYYSSDHDHRPGR